MVQAIPILYALLVAGAVTRTGARGMVMDHDETVRRMAGDVFFAILDAQNANAMLAVCDYEAGPMRQAALMLCRLAYLDRTEPWVAA